MALNYGRATLFSILSTMSVSQPLSPAVWTNLVRAGITRVKPTRRGSRAGRLERRAIATLVSNPRQPSVQHLHCNKLYGKVFANCPHSWDAFVVPTNIHCIWPQRPLVLSLRFILRLYSNHVNVFPRGHHYPILFSYYL